MGTTDVKKAECLYFLNNYSVEVLIKYVTLDMKSYFID